MSDFLQIDRLHCRYQDLPIVDKLCFTIEQGEVACLLGPSGCGKTTVLRAIAGFHPLLSGRVILAGRVLSNAGLIVAPENRKMSMVFQDYALFPHLTVRENVAFGLRKHSRKERQYIVDDMLELVKLPSFGARYPHELSGGQQQRVALARGLAPHPMLLLMDEPFSNLDSELRRLLYIEVRDILKEKGITTLVVTHDKEEAFTVSDKIGILAEGQLQQWGTPVSLFHSPLNQRVASFMGPGQFITGHALKHNQVETEIGLIHVNNGEISWSDGDKLEIFLRPDEVIPYPDDQLVQGEVVNKQFMGTSTLHTLRLPSGLLIDTVFSNSHELQLGEKTGLRVETRNLLIFMLNGNPAGTACGPYSIKHCPAEQLTEARQEL